MESWGARLLRNRQSRRPVIRIEPQGKQVILNVFSYTVNTCSLEKNKI